MYKFEFSKKDCDFIKEQAMLDDELSKLLEYKIKGYSITKIALLLNISNATVSRRTKKLINRIKKIL